LRRFFWKRVGRAPLGVYTLKLKRIKSWFFKIVLLGELVGVDTRARESS